MRKLLILSIFFGSLFSIPVVNAATVHQTGISSVDGSEIRWGGSTKYSTAWNHAVSAWNGLGDVNIAPDTIFTIEDLDVADVDEPDELWTAVWIHSVGDDDIHFNVPVMDQLTSDHNKKTAMHELGHALGIGDHEESSYSGIIMYGFSSTVTSLASHDIADYNSIY